MRVAAAWLGGWLLTWSGLGLAQGQVQGVVTDSVTGQPVAGVTLRLGSVIFGGFFQSTLPTSTSNALGAFSFDQVPTGSYALRAEPAQPYVPMLWPNHPCTPDLRCSPGFQGGNLAVSSGSITTADLALLVPGSISGSVVSAANAAPIVDARLRAWLAGPTLVLETSTSTGGSYVFNGLIPGNYTIEVVEAPGHVREVYDDVQCTPTCGTGTQVAVAAGVDTPAVDIVLAQAASIEGVVRDQGSVGLLHGNTVHLTRLDAGAASSWAAPIVAAGAGGFRLDGLPAGEYRLSTSATVGDQRPTYRQEVYGGAACATLSCNLFEILAGSPILLTEGESRAGIDLALEPLGSIQGCVAGGGGPLANVTVIAYRIENLFGTAYVPLASAVTGNDGCYTITHLPPGTARALQLHTSNTLGYRDQVHAGLECGLSCPLLAGAGIPLGFDEDATGFDFLLQPGPRLRGTLRDAITMDGVSDLRVRLFVPSGAEIRPNDSDMRSAGDGAWSSVVLAAGTYFVQVEAPTGPYRGRHLLGGGSCFPHLGELCPAPTTGTPIQLASLADVIGVDLVLQRPVPIHADGFE